MRAQRLGEGAVPQRGLLQMAVWIGLAATIGLATGLDPRLSIVIVGAIAGPLLIWTNPTVGLAILCVALGVNVDVVSSPAHVSLPQLASLAVIAAIALRTAPAHDRVKLSRLWGFGGLLLVVAALPSLVRSPNQLAAIVGLVQFSAVGALLYAVVRWVGASPQATDRLMTMLVIGGVVSVLPAIVQVVLGLGPEEYRMGGLSRAYSTYGQPNSYGQYLAGLAPVCCAMALRDRRYSWAFFVILMGIALSGSRGAWLATLAGFGVLYLITSRLKPSTILTGAVGVLGLLGLVALLPEAFIAGRFDFSDWSTQQRLLILLTTVDGILRNPILGYGADSFALMLPDMARAGLVDDVIMPHNMLLHVWFELGLAALLVFVGLMAAYFTRSIRAYRHSRDLRLAGLVSGVAAMLTASMFGSLFIRGISETFVVLIGLSACFVVPRKVDRP